MTSVLRRLEGREFWKMTGSGNDFVFFDARAGVAEELEQPEVIQAICHRTRGIGADGIVLLKPGDAPAMVSIRYYNSDGSLASLCGNATLCATRLATQLVAEPPDIFGIGTDAGLVVARLGPEAPEIDLQPLRALQADFSAAMEGGEQRVGYVEAGVPHLVVLVEDVQTVPVDVRGRVLRTLPQLAAGANVNFVSGSPGRWWMRTYERGVEGETLACGTGSVATAALLRAWDKEAGEVRITTRSGLDHVVRIREDAGDWLPSLQGEGRVVYRGTVGTLG